MPIRFAAARFTAALAAALALLPASGPALAGSTRPVDVRPAAAADIAPHRAIYRMSLKSARNSSKVTDVNGSMMFEWADACDGWTTEQRFQLRFVYAEGEAMNMNTTYTTWEAKDGKRYRFNVRKLVNGEVDEEVRGDATTAEGEEPGVARFTKPEDTEMELDTSTMFPTAHTLAILDHANADERFFARTVFDGADADGPTEISVVIGNPTITKDESTPLLKGQKAWPVRMAFFPVASDSPQPEYEMSIRLLRNGVADSMQIDYGDFSVNAILEKVEALPKSGC